MKVVRISYNNIKVRREILNIKESNEVVGVPFMRYLHHVDVADRRLFKTKQSPIRYLARQEHLNVTASMNMKKATESLGLCSSNK